MIIRYKLAELIKRVYDAGNPALPQPRFKRGYGGESNHALPQPCFKHDRRVMIILAGSC